MKKIISIALSLTVLTPLLAAEKRTDGKPGSEYADFGSFEGDFSIGAQFGALLSTRNRSDGSFALALDGDYRPYDLFGFRATLLQGFNTPKTTLVSLTPLLHSQFSNFHPYLLVGPGFGIFNDKGTTARFTVSFGTGGDVELTRHLLIGMLWIYHSVVASADAHALSARISYKF